MKKIYIKEEYCIGCRLCEIYCQVKHSKSKKILKAFREEQDIISRVLVEEIGHNSFAIQCRHCVDAPCVDACISGAMTKNENTGVVNCDENKCVGCWSCIMVCPYGVIKRDISAKRAASKCDFCEDEKIPVCVKNCPNEALKFSDTDDSDSNAGNYTDADNNSGADSDNDNEVDAE
jgi:carbon-monoxide dehydrogenase iron sulfur subunit